MRSTTSNIAAKPSRWEEAEAKREAERKSEKEDFDRRNAEHRACEDDKAESSRLTVIQLQRSVDQQVKESEARIPLMSLEAATLERIATALEALTKK